MKSVSKAAGLGDTFVRDLLERDREPSVENAIAICSALRVSLASIFAPESEGRTITKSGRIVEIAGVEYANLPVHDIRFAAGAGAENWDETPIDYYLLSLNLLRSVSKAPIEEIAIFQADGDSMEPTINNRDWFLVDMRRKQLTNPGIYALVFEGQALLKRAAQHLESKEVTLVSDNRRYPVQKIKRPERLTVVGRVFLSIRRH